MSVARVWSIQVLKFSSDQRRTPTTACESVQFGDKLIYIHIYGLLMRSVDILYSIYVYIYIYVYVQIQLYIYIFS